MPIIGAFMGGGQSICEAGSGVVQLDWITEDGENMKGSTFTLTGPQTYTATADSNGHAELTVVVGTYTVTITHGGEYYGDTERTLTVESRKEHRVTWFGTIATLSIVNFNGVSISSASYEIVDQMGVIKISGSDWRSSMSFNLYMGDYTLRLTAYGTTVEYQFEVLKDTTQTFNIKSIFTTITISGLPKNTSVTVNGVSAGVVTSVVVPRSGDTITMSYTPPTYGDGTAIASISDSSVILDSETKIVSPAVTGNVRIFTSSGTVTVPKGVYGLLVVGGGGGGAGSYYYSYHYRGGGGGGSGRFVQGDLNLSGDYSYTIGAGGSAGASEKDGGAGGATSFSNLLSASGGSGGNIIGSSADKTSGCGGSGGAGGGGGTYGYGYGGEGFDAGGGGGGGSNKGGSGLYGNGGKSDLTPVLPTSGYNDTDRLLVYSGYGGVGGGGGGGGLSDTSVTGGIGGNSDGRGGGGTNGSYSSSYNNTGGGGGGGGMGGAAGGRGGDGYNSIAGYAGQGYGAGGGGASGRYASSTNYDGGGGGGGGFGRISNTQASSYNSSTAGVKGCIVMMWRSDE